MVDMDLKAHAAFFNRLVDLIPAKHYLAEAEDRVDLRFVKRSERDAAKAQFKAQHKEAKRAKFNPETAKGTIDLQKDKAAKEDAAAVAATVADADAASEEGSEGEDQGEDMVKPTEEAAPGSSPSREALREKLQQRLEQDMQVRCRGA